MEQLVWAIIFIIFITFTVLRNRARKKAEPDIYRERRTEAESEKESDDRLGRYLEELLGVEITEKKPQPRVKKDRPIPGKTRVTPAPEQEKPKKIGEFEPLLTGEYEEKWKSPVPEKKAICRAGFSWGRLSKKDLPNAIILAEIIGPPIAKRKSHRLF